MQKQNWNLGFLIKISLLGLVLSCFGPVYGQAKPDSLLPGFGKRDFRIPVNVPVYDGGVDALFGDIQKAIDLKVVEEEMARRNMAPKRYMLRFWVKNDGKITNPEVIGLPSDGSDPLANQLLNAVRKLPDFKAEATDRYGNPAAYNYIVPIWLHGSEILVGQQGYSLSDLRWKDGKAWFGSYPFSGLADSIHQNKKLIKRQYFLGGLPHGKRIEWDEYGNKLFEANFQQGKMVSCFDANGGFCRSQCENGTPRFLSGQEGLQDWMDRSLEYPYQLEGQGATVTVVWEIDTTGKVTWAQMWEGDGFYNRGAMKFHHDLPANWEPCLVKGEPVTTRILHPVRFRPHVNALENLILAPPGYFHGDTLYSGMIFEYESGAIRTLAGRIEAGQRVGLWQYWDRQGRKTREETYVDGKLNGEAKEWIPGTGESRVLFYEEGKLSQALVQAFSKPDSILRREVTRWGGPELPNGTFLEWFENGNQAASGAWENGLPEGKWNYFHPNGQLASSLPFEAGRLNGTVEQFDTLGARVGKSTWEQGQLKKGRRVSFYANGAIRSKETRKKGLRKGKFEEFSPQGTLIRRSKWKKGIIKGPLEVIQNGDSSANLLVFPGNEMPGEAGTGTLEFIILDAETGESLNGVTCQWQFGDWGGDIVLPKGEKTPFSHSHGYGIFRFTKPGYRAVQHREEFLQGVKRTFVVRMEKVGGGQ